MTPIQFKEKYPEHKDLEGDILWDLMGEMLLKSDNTLTADPDRHIVYHDPVSIPVLQDDGTYTICSIKVENELETVWINSKGDKVRLPPSNVASKATTSHRMVIWDASEANKYKK